MQSLVACKCIVKEDPFGKSCDDAIFMIGSVGEYHFMGIMDIINASLFVNKLGDEPLFVQRVQVIITDFRSLLIDETGIAVS